MNNIQLVLVVETDKKSKTDFYYINSILDYYYNIGENRISYVYMGSKYNYNSEKVVKEINKWVKNYSVVNKGQSFVIYFFDKDLSSSKYEDLEFNNEVTKYCNDNSFDLVWFVQNIEDVMIGVNNVGIDKVKSAMSFYTQNKIRTVDEKNLRLNHNVTNQGRSNVLTVFDKFNQIKKAD